ncbi:conjugal transfer protein TraG N-terminal domain-containing protein [Shewanella sp. GD03713]|uniref:conjugal transfer protein TraG N-terminal domain-containing protein n=1 Tax=Shewanella sp. GD03713 TaxID=2975372 RepID=UPI00244726DE|nr:conjugal transfer protein TraG N-terminal domain-containing protein [Shewanella sp. GD03713]MDH1472653.1 conjugal transfer protein TraG N-terminal domain-containing protein [Shewanella sp. GD03713]
MQGFVIYSMGDPEFIRLALLGLSHAFEQGAVSVAKIGLMLCLLGVFWKGVWSPDKIEFKQFFMGFFLVFLLFVKQVPVTLIHNDGAGADQMPPIPIGIALAGTIATNFGYSMANSMRDFYHTTYQPGNAQTGSYRAMVGLDNDGTHPVPVAGNGLAPLRELMKMRFDGSVEAYSKANASIAGAGGASVDISKSLENYIHDCVLKDEFNGRSVQEVNTAAMHTAAYAWPNMRVTYDGWSTSVKIDAGHGWKTMGCGAAYNKIDGAINSTWKDIALKDNSIEKAPNEALVNIGSQMLGDVNSEAWKIKVNQLIHYHYNKTKAKSRWASEADLMASQVEFEAIDKRRVSSAVQHSLWSEMAIPLMSYIEAFVFLIGPIMPFIVAFGEKGAGLVLKYFFLLVWVNTWPILQVGVNMYLQNSINKASFANSNYEAFSWAGYNTSFTEVESFIAMGSTLQTMVPALSLMLLYGSAHTMINVANSAQKGGGGEGAQATPNAATPTHSGKSSVGNTNWSYDKNANGMLQTYSGDSSSAIGMKQFNTSNAISAANSNAIQAAQEKVESAGTQRSAINSEMANMMKVGADEKSMQISGTANKSLGLNLANTYADQLMKTGHYTAEEAKTLGVALSGGMGAQLQGKVAAALKLPTGGGEEGDKGKKSPFSAGIALEASGGVDVKNNANLQSALRKTSSLANQGTNSWSFGESEQGQAAFQKAQSLVGGAKIGENGAWGEVGQRAEQASRAWTEANKIVESESRQQTALQGISGGLSFNMMGATSDALSNKVDDKFADGTLLAETARKTAFGDMDSTQRANYEAFKANGGFGQGLDGDMKALSAFSKTEQGASLTGMASNFKTTAQNKGDFEARVGNASTLQERREAVGRYADNAFQNLLNTSGSHRYDAGANMLDIMNQASGGKMANWAAAANDLRKVADHTEEALKTPAPKTANEAGGPTEKSVNDKVSQVSTDSKGFIAAQQSRIDETNLEKVHSNDKQALRNEVQADSGKKGEQQTLMAVGATAAENAKPLDKAVAPLTEQQKPAMSLAETLADISTPAWKAAGDIVDNVTRETAYDRLTKQGVDESAARILGGESSKTQHSDIVETVARGLQVNATPTDQVAAAKLLAGAQKSDEVIKDLRSSGNPENMKLADSLEKNKNVVENAFNSANADGGQKELIRGLGTALNNGSASNDGALYMFEPNNIELRSSLQAKEQQHAAQQGTLAQMEANGATDTKQYQELKQQADQLGKYLERNEGARTMFDAWRGYEGSMGKAASDGGPSRDVVVDEIGKGIIKDAVLGKNNNSLSNASFSEALKEQGSDYSRFTKAFGRDGITTNIDAMRQYEQMRPGLEGAVAELRKNPENAEKADRLDQRIQELDKLTGFDQREITSLTGNVGYSSSDRKNVETATMSSESLNRVNEASIGQKFQFGDSTTFTKVFAGEGQDPKLLSETGQLFSVSSAKDGSGVMQPSNDQVSKVGEVAPSGESKPNNNIGEVNKVSPNESAINASGKSSDETGTKPASSGVAANAQASEPVSTSGNVPGLGTGKANENGGKSSDETGTKPASSGVAANAQTSEPVSTSGNEAGVGSGKANEKGGNVSSTTGEELAIKAKEEVNTSGTVSDEPTLASNVTLNSGRGNYEQTSHSIATETGKSSGAENQSAGEVNASFVSSSYGDGDRINVSPDSFQSLHSAETGSKFDIAGETFTKTGGNEDGNRQTTTLMHDKTGDTYNLYQNNDGTGNLTIEAKDGKF